LELLTCVCSQGHAIESENSSLDAQVDHSTKDYSNYVVIEQSEIERIEGEVRGRKLQEQESAVKMANQLQQAFSVWQHDDSGTAIEGCSGSGIGDDTLVESSSIWNSTDALDSMTLCQFLVDLELGKLESQNLHGARQSEDMASPSPDLDPQLEAVGDVGKENGHTASLTSRQRYHVCSVFLRLLNYELKQLMACDCTGIRRLMRFYAIF
jgi:hypothetical protein